MARVAQLVEHQIVDLRVAGSYPVSCPSLHPLQIRQRAYSGGCHRDGVDELSQVKWRRHPPHWLDLRYARIVMPILSLKRRSRYVPEPNATVLQISEIGSRVDLSSEQTFSSLVSCTTSRMLRPVICRKRLSSSRRSRSPAAGSSCRSRIVSTSPGRLFQIGGHCRFWLSAHVRPI